MKKIFTYGSIKNGKLYISKRKEFDININSWKDCRIKLTIEKLYKKRSIFQNAYYWGVVIDLFCEGYKYTTGENIHQSEAHETLKFRFNSKEIVNNETGEILKVIKSTTEMSTSEYMEYIENCRKFILEYFNIYVPEPNEQTKIEYPKQ